MARTRSTRKPSARGRKPARSARGRAPPPRASRAAGADPRPPAARLWAPWRMEFILAPRTEGCIFCDFPAQEGDEADRRNLIVHRSARAFTVLNRFPYNSGHVMVIPRAHVAQLDALAPEDFGALHEELRLATATLRRVYRPEGLNVGMNLGRVAGAGIADHLHYHVVPRWGGDTNFMPVLAETRVMVEHLDATWQRIRDGFGAA